jgi:hypothetical protein
MTASLLARVLEALEEKQIPFALIGAAAMAAHRVSLQPLASCNQICMDVLRKETTGYG